MRRALASTMLAARLHGPRDIRFESVPHPGPPQPGEVLVRVKATGVCGSDLHSYKDARIGDTPVPAPLILGHEFAGVIEAVGESACDGAFQPLHPGAHVAVDPAQPCGRCEPCEMGNPNLCGRLHFCGLFPDNGSLAQWIRMPARCCFPLPESMSFEEGAMLEPLGVAIHAVDLAKLRVGNSVAVIGAGPIGLCILKMAKLAGADPVFVADRLPWRLKVASRLGAVSIHAAEDDPAEYVRRETGGRGVDAAFEAAWADQSVEHAAEMVRAGGRLVLVGIPSNDRLEMRHSTARRNGLTILMSRRMKHVYPRAIHLTVERKLNLADLISHRFPLKQAAEAFALNAAYEDKVVKVIVHS